MPRLPPSTELGSQHGSSPPRRNKALLSNKVYVESSVPSLLVPYFRRAYDLHPLRRSQQNLTGFADQHRATLAADANLSRVSLPQISLEGLVQQSSSHQDAGEYIRHFMEQMAQMFHFVLAEFNRGVLAGLAQ